MRRFARWASALAILCLSSHAVAQAHGVPQTSRVLREVERGFWVGSHFGAVHFFDLPDEAGSATGGMVGIEAGVDLGSRLQLGLLALGQSVGASADFQGVQGAGDPRGARGDFQSMLLGGSLRWAFLGLSDENGIERTYFFTRLGGGLSYSRPVGVLDENGTFALAGLGVEYFTKLRRFSLGLELDWMGLFGESVSLHGVSVLPRLKYTF